MSIANTSQNIHHNPTQQRRYVSHIEQQLLSDNDTTVAVKPKKIKSANLSSKSTEALSVLLIEDDPLVQRVHSMMLTKLEYHVDIAANGVDALTLFSQNSYDIVLTDVGLPEMSGIEIIAEIRRREKFKNPIPIIAITAYSQEEVKNDCLEAGANEVATKPIAMSALQELLQRFSDVKS